ncbi:MAG: Txe/YoeB family addiction module toxin [Oscillospiraceae bacterium]|jgi:toxin YoeB|nr:Txe/YoeB family addiction module toxin [Oscillospiraceae bacterium]
MKKLWDDNAWEEYEYWQGQDRKTLKKINRLIKSIERNGYECESKPKPLKHDLSGYWSVRIDKENRLIFKIDNDVLKIAACRGHYDDD